MKKFFICLMLIINIIRVYSQQVSQEEALLVATNMIRQCNIEHYNIASQLDTVYTYCSNNHNILYEILFYPNIRVLVSGNKSTEPVLGIYTMGNGSILKDNEVDCQGAKNIVYEYVDQIKLCFDSLYISDYYVEKWERMQDTAIRNGLSYIVAPLIQSKWNQSISNDGLDCTAYNYWARFYLRWLHK